jgi:heavy metal sensor kinase
MGAEQDTFRVLATALDGPGGRQVLLVASSLEGVEESLERLRLLLLFAVPGALLLAGAGGWLLAGKALWPVARMTRQAEAIGSGHLHERISVPPARDELALLAETLNTMLGRIERSVTEQRRFLADASHELRTPLAILRTELEVGLRDARRANGSAEVLESSLEEVDRMSGVVESLLTLARADEGQLELLREPVDLGEVAEAVVAKLRPITEAKRISLTLNGEGPKVIADRGRVAQVVTNLLDNAVTYTAPGGTIQVRVWEAGDEAGLSVRDTGPGIAPANLPLVFDRFFRADAARGRARGGSGLGLAICRELVEAHGGRIGASSRQGAGSVFTVTLPRARA